MTIEPAEYEHLKKQALLAATEEKPWKKGLVVITKALAKFNSGRLTEEVYSGLKEVGLYIEYRNIGNGPQEMVIREISKEDEQD